MATLKKIKLKNEKELHSVIEKELEALEEGLTILKYEFAISKGVTDFLCADSGGRLVIIEVKLQEDENILFQGLRYYNEIDRDRYVIAKMFSRKDVDPKELKMGIEVEREHTSDPKIAERIAKDHLAEIPDYYTRLAVMEEEGKRANE